MGWPKWSFDFSHMMAIVALSCLLTSFETILLDCIVASLLRCISTYLKKLVKIGEVLYSYFNIEGEREKATFYVYYTSLFQERYWVGQKVPLVFK